MRRAAAAARLRRRCSARARAGPRLPRIEFGFTRAGRAQHRARAQHGAADDAARRDRLPLHVPGRHRVAQARARGARAAAAGRRRRDGGRHRPRDPQPARVDVRVDPDPAPGAAAHGRAVAADGHRAARVGSAERDDPQLPRVRAAAAARDRRAMDVRQVITDTARCCRTTRSSSDGAPRSRWTCRRRTCGTRPTRARSGRSSGTSRPTALRAMPNGGTLRLSVARHEDERGPAGEAS